MLKRIFSVKLISIRLSEHSRESLIIVCAKIKIIRYQKVAHPFLRFSVLVLISL